jgi:hypothetical protein
VQRRISASDRQQQIFVDDRTDLCAYSDRVDAVVVRLLNYLERMPAGRRSKLQQQYVRRYSLESAQRRSADTEAVLNELIDQCKLDRQLAQQTRQVMLSMFPEASTSPRTSCCELRKSPPPFRSPPTSPRLSKALSSESAAETSGLSTFGSPRRWLRKSRAHSETALTDRLAQK